MFELEYQNVSAEQNMLHMYVGIVEVTHSLTH